MQAKVFTDVTVLYMDPKTHEPIYWLGGSISIYEWCQKHNLPHYQIIYNTAERHNAHNLYKQGMFSSIVPQACKDYITDFHPVYGKEIFIMMLKSLEPEKGSSKISKICAEADAESTRADLRSNNRALDETRTALRIAPDIALLMEELLLKKILQPVTRKHKHGEFIYTHEGETYIIWDAVWNTIVEYVRTNQRNIILDRKLVVQALVDYDLISERVADGHRQKYWHIRHELNDQQSFVCLKCTSRMDLLRSTGLLLDRVGVRMEGKTVR